MTENEQTIINLLKDMGKNEDEKRFAVLSGFYVTLGYVKESASSEKDPAKREAYQDVYDQMKVYEDQIKSLQ